jgi:hypothetical protein
VEELQRQRRLIQEQPYDPDQVVEQQQQQRRRRSRWFLQQLPPS